MKRIVLGAAAAAFMAATLAATPATAQTDQRCMAYQTSESRDRCRCNVEAGGVIVGVDGKGNNRWDVPGPRINEFSACLRRLGYRG